MEYSKEEIDQFVETNLLNFVLKGKGWYNLLRNMLYEICLAGWNLNDNVGGKEKFGGLRCYAYSEDEQLNTEVQKILQKYEALSVSTCEECGNKGKPRVVQGWDIILCINHYMNEISVLHIKDDIVFLNDRFLFKFGEIEKVETLNSFRGMQVYLSGGEKFISLNIGNPNYYMLLRSIPLHVFSKEDSDQIRLMFENLEDCEVCGHTALWKDRCLRCNEEAWQESFLEDYEDKTDYLKYCQMYLHVDRDGYEEVSNFCDRSFNKIENHRILFNSDELEEFKKEW